MQGWVSYKKDPDRWVFVCVCVCLCAHLCERGSVCVWSRETTNDVNLVYGRGNGMTCVSKIDKGMCSSGIAWVRVGSKLFGRDIECVWERGVRARERERELATERERGREGAFVSINGL